MEAGTMALHYDAFISYRHAPLDIRVAAEIQRGLERFHIPREIRKKTGRQKIERIFRDKEELPITSDINDDITAALKNSDHLIVICSTNTASSIWVQREIETFLKDHDHRHVLTVLADGEPQDVIPDILRYEQIQTRDESGAVHTERREIEPLSCDFRLKRSQARREELPRLAAVLLGCAYDELRQRQRRHRIRQMVAGFSAALILVSAVAAYAVNRAYVIARQAEQIEQEYRNTLISQSRYLSEKSLELLAQGDRMGAIQVALSALPAGEADDSRPLVTEALYALNSAVYPYHIAQPDEFLAKCTLQTDGSGGAWALQDDCQRLSPDGTRWMTTDKSGRLYVFDLEKDVRIASITPQDVLPGAESAGFLSADFLSSDQIVLYTGECAVCWDIRTNSALWRTRYADADIGADSYGFIGAGSLADRQRQTLLAALIDSDGRCYLCRLDAATGEVRSSLSAQLPVFGLYGLKCHMALSPGGARAAVGFEDGGVRDESGEPGPALLLLADLESGTYQMVSAKNGDIASLAFLDDDQLCLLTTDMYYADYIDHTFSYAVERYDFPSGSVLWSTSGELEADRAAGVEARPTSALWLWTRKLDDGTTEDLLLAQLAGRLLLLAPENGQVLRTADFSADILDIYAYDAGKLFLAFQNGQLIVYMPVSSAYGEMGSVSGALRGAAFVPGLGQCLLALEDSQDIVVMSDRLEDPELASAAFEADVSVDYAFGDGWEYRIVCQSGDEASDGAERLLFYLPLSDTPFAATDAEGSIDGFDVLHADQGEDVCYYLLHEDDTLCGWGLESNEKVFSYDLGESSGEILGFSDGQILLKTGDILRLIDPDSGSEKNMETMGSVYTEALSPDGRYLAVLGPSELGLLDTRQWTWIDLPEALKTLGADHSQGGGNISFSPDGNRLALWADEELAIVDLASLSIEQCVQIPCRSSGYSLFLNDHVLLVYGDSGHLTTWDLAAQAVVMEDPFDDVLVGQELIRGNGCFQTGGPTPYLYAFEEDGRFARYLSVGYGRVSPTGSEVLRYRNAYGAGNAVTLIENDAFSIYPLYTLDQLVAKASEALDGRTLTSAEKIRYFIE